MSEKVQNPQTREEAKDELISICEQFHPDWLREQVSRDENGDITVKKFFTGDTRSKTANISMAIVGSHDAFDSEMVYPDNSMAQLSLEDYQSVAVAKNVNYTAKKLISLCAKGQAEEADKIFPGFSEKYGSSISVFNDGSTYAVDGEVFKQLENDIRKNFSTVHPEFLDKTQEQWKVARQEMMLTEAEFDNTSISDSAYYLLVKTHYVYPGADNDKVFAQIRGENDAVVADLQTQQKQQTKEIMKNDSQKAKQSMESKQLELKSEKVVGISPLAMNNKAINTSPKPEINIIQMKKMQKING